MAAVAFSVFDLNECTNLLGASWVYDVHLMDKRIMGDMRVSVEHDMSASSESHT